MDWKGCQLTGVREEPAVAAPHHITGRPSEVRPFGMATMGGPHAASPSSMRIHSRILEQADYTAIGGGAIPAPRPREKENQDKRHPVDTNEHCHKKPKNAPWGRTIGEQPSKSPGKPNTVNHDHRINNATSTTDRPDATQELKYLNTRGPPGVTNA